MGLLNSPVGCLVCLKSTENVLISAEESQEIFNVCSLYVKGAINIGFLIKNINGNNNKLSFCKNCLDSSLTLSQLVEKLSKLKTEINDFTNSFSENITKHRCQATAGENKNKFSDEATAFHNVIIPSSNMISSDDLMLFSLSSNSDQNSSAPNESSSHLIINHNVERVDTIKSGIVKIENEGIFPDCEQMRCTDNLSGYREEEYETNCSGTVNEIDPLAEIGLQPPYGVANNFNIINELKPQIGTSESFSNLASSMTRPNIKILQRIRKDDTSPSGGTFDSTATSCQDEPDVIANKIDGPSYNSAIKSSSMKQKIGQTGKRLHNCSICQNGFHTSQALKKHHGRKHSGEKPYKCSVCDKAYIKLSHLKNHERIHTGEKPYKCSSCENSYTQLASLKYHERTHSGSKPYKCSQCSMSFIWAGNLKHHEQTHTNEKPFKCSHCGKAFTRANKLQDHERRTHTGETPFQCSYCELKFQCKPSRTRHQKKVHPDM